MKDKKTEEKLKRWKAKLAKAEASYEAIYQKFDGREELYDGKHALERITSGDEDEITNAPKRTQHCYNIIAENIESEVDTTIPMPKVTARRQKNEWLAKKIEYMLRNELDRLPMEELNDMMERTVPIQGGALYLVEWDENPRNRNETGDNVISVIHPKQFIPQPGVYTSMDDMDWFFLKIPQTKEYIKRRYGVDVSEEEEENPEVRGDLTTPEDGMVTQYIAFFRNDNGGVGRFSWVNNTIIEDAEDYQARRIRRCKKCGMPEAAGGLLLEKPTMDGEYPEGGETEKRAAKGSCAFCGSRSWEESEELYEEIYAPTLIGGPEGEIVGGSGSELDDFGNVVATPKERIPYFKPDDYPVILQKNISKYGQLLGESDADKIADQQNTLNRLSQKIIDRICKAGTRIVLPEDPKITIDQKDNEVWRIRNAADAQMIGTYAFDGNIEYELAYRAQVYEEARRVLGITDSFQGREDSTATSGRAKEFAAAQSAGRLECKRKMKQANYQRLYKMLFFNRLAYADQPMALTYVDEKGQQQYDQFNRYDFLERDEKTGEWKYITDFIFDCDEASGLARNRQAMWQEITQQFQAGAFGNPAEYATLIIYWTKMEAEHYPDAGQTKKLIEEQLQQQQQAMMQAQMQQQAMQQQTLAAAQQDAQRDFAAQQMQGQMQ